MNIETSNYSNNIEIEQNILNYMMGKLTQEKGYNQPMFIDNGFTEGTIKDRIFEKLKLVENATHMLLLGKIYDETLTNWLVYGFYSIGEYNEENGYDASYGYIYIMDNNLNEITLLTHFDSGSRLFPIVSLNKDENNNYYGLTYDVNSSNPLTRVVLLNNILGSGQKDGNYVVSLKKSYVTPMPVGTNPYRQNRIIKSKGEAKYYIITHANSKTQIIKFEINVGFENSWNTYTLDGLIDSVQFAVLIDKIEDETALHIYGIEILNNQQTYREYKIIGNSLTKGRMIRINGEASMFGTQVFIKDLANIYIVISDIKSRKTILYKIQGNDLKTLWTSKDWDSEIDSNGTTKFYEIKLQLELINNVVFFQLLERNQVECDVSVGILQDDIMFETYLHSNENSDQTLYEYVDFYITNNYNLYNIYVPRKNSPHFEPSMVNLKLIYNPLNYNGYKYSNSNLLVPNSAVLYNDLNVPIFARNLYNKIVNDNSTVSTVQIPNTLCNNQKIALSTLKSETNMPVASNIKNITKNIYETVYLNFINLINIVDNNKGNLVSNLQASTKLNYAINTPTEYENVKMTKFRINYEDGTSSVSFFDVSKELDFSNKYILTIAFYLEKKAISLEFISNDEQTVFCTIDLSSYEINKAYSLKQRVRIGDD